MLIAETLLDVETLNAEEIDYLLKNRKMPDEVVEETKEVVKEEVTKQETNQEQELLINEDTLRKDDGSKEN